MRAILASLLVVAALLGMTACGGGGDTGSPETRPAASPTVTRTPSPERTQGTQAVASPSATATAPAEQSQVAQPSAQPPPVSPSATEQAEVTPTETQPTASPTATEQAGVVQSAAQRITSPAVPQSDLAELVAGNTAFAFDLYQALRTGDGNLFFSPYSISQALAMTYAGAAGETEQQMADTLSFTLPDDRFHPAFNALDLELASRGEAQHGSDAYRFQLNIANAIWGQQGYGFLPEFLDVLAQNYGAGLRLLDFIRAPEESRVTINDWVSEQTEGKIEDLIEPGLINSAIRLVLTNAIYFNAGWAYPFQPENTQEGPFHLLDGGQVTVPMMKQTQTFGYSEGDVYQAVSLPYGLSGMSMVLIVPDAGQFEAFESALSADQVGHIRPGNGGDLDVTLTMPKFSFKSSFGLSDTLAAMGMPDAFGNADFSGMTGNRDLSISFVVHKAFVSVDEKGTEAAAATGIGILTSAPQQHVDLVVDRPFILLIRDDETGAILFVGRVLDPTA